MASNSASAGLHAAERDNDGGFDLLLRDDLSGNGADRWMAIAVALQLRERAASTDQSFGRCRIPAPCVDTSVDARAFLVGSDV